MQMHFSAASACGRKNDKEFPGLEAQEQIYAAQARTMPIRFRTANAASEDVQFLMATRKDCLASQ
jgi:hypothetical protein